VFFFRNIIIVSLIVFNWTRLRVGWQIKFCDVIVTIWNLIKMNILLYIGWLEKTHTHFISSDSIIMTIVYAHFFIPPRNLIPKNGFTRVFVRIHFINGFHVFICNTNVYVSYSYRYVRIVTCECIIAWLYYTGHSRFSTNSHLTPFHRIKKIIDSIFGRVKNCTVSTTVFD